MSNTPVTVLPSPLSNIHQYLSLVESFPRLDNDEERALAERYRAENDLDAAWRLVTSHLRYVVYIARGYTGYGLPQDDIIQEGNVGLMKAVQRFDPSRGVRLRAYAVFWIRASIHDFILKNWRIVKIATTKSRRKLFYKLRGLKKRLEWLNRAEAEKIAETLEVPPDDVIDMEAKLYLPDQPIDPPADKDEDGPIPPSCLEDQRFEPASLVTRHDFVVSATSELRAALDTLDARSRDIVESRWLKDTAERATLQELGDRYGVSAERVRQIEAAAFKQLRNVIGPRLGFSAT